ncbi:MAG: phosphate uptake regulator PhoU [Nitrososphaeria archaeon]|nr:phosphate uptake regulator PhoU [Nitrososphaeria archaeon]
MDIGLERLKNLVAEMGEYSAKTVFLAIDSYGQGEDLMDHLYVRSKEIQKMHDEASELAVELIARYQPVASDLRFIKSCMEIGYGFLRFSRYAFDISQVLRLFGDVTVCDKKEVIRAGEHVKEMVKISIKAFIEKDIDLAKKVREMDTLIDKMYLETLKKASKTTNNNIKCIISEVLVLRYIERIADHATYIADSVVYIVSGEKRI